MDQLPFEVVHLVFGYLPWYSDLRTTGRRCVVVLVVEALCREDLSGCMVTVTIGPILPGIDIKVVRMDFFCWLLFLSPFLHILFVILYLACVQPV